MENRKKYMIIAFVVLLILSLSGIQLYNKFNQKDELKIEVEEIKKQENEKISNDTNPPILKLKISNYQTFPKNTIIDYKNLIEVAKDKEDGNLIEKVRWNKIDNTLVNIEQIIIYDVEDKAGNQTIVSLTVVFTDTDNQLPIGDNFETINNN